MRKIVYEPKLFAKRKEMIAEIRKWHDGGVEKFPPITVFEAIGFLIDELDRMEREYTEERAAHNAHVTELCQLEEENRKLREELETLKRLNRIMREDVDDAYQQLREERKQLQSAQQDRDKLIEGLRWYAKKDTHEIKRRPDGDYAPIVLDHGQRARDILKEIGVTVE